jgi:hypothetical protein
MLTIAIWILIEDVVKELHLREGLSGLGGTMGLEGARNADLANEVKHAADDKMG